MKKFLQKIGAIKMEESFATPKTGFLSFINSHPELFCLSLLLIACFLFLVSSIANYPLMDVDETRYAIMARDMVLTHNWNNLMLNGVPFLEKPPLYFWLVGASIKFFHSFNPLVVRLPIALLASFLVFFTYFVGKKVISRKFGMTSAFVLLGSIFYLLFAHVAILDMVLTVFMTSSIYFGFLTHFCKEQNKKYYWFAFYVFMALGVLAKGLLAVVLPVAIIFTYNLLTKTVKDIFKPANLLPGFVAFLLISIPWHVVMYQEYGFKFVKEYFLAHHFARFINSVSIGRERPFLYFVPVFLLGFMPWTFTFVAFLVDGFKKLGAKYKEAEGNFLKKAFAVINVENNEQKMMLFASVAFAIIFLVFSGSSTKLPTYILPAFPFASLLMGYYWWVADERSEHEKATYNATIVLATILVAAGFFGIFGYYFLSYDLQNSLVEIKQIVILSLFVVSILLALRLNTKRALSIFAGYIMSMFLILTIAVCLIFNFVYYTGEKELVLYSLVAEANNRKETQLVTFDFAVKPSVMIEYSKKVSFITDPKFNELDELLKNKDKSTFVIVKNKNYEDNPEYKKKIEDRLTLLMNGKKYSLYTGK